MSNTTWTFQELLSDGHRLFVAEDGEYAIADNSGLTPEDTDDGTLWLDTSRCLSIADKHISIPLTDQDGTPTRTISGASTILYLSWLLDWTIEDTDNKTHYKVQKANVISA